MADYKFAVVNDYTGGADGAADDIDGSLLSDADGMLVIKHSTEKASIHTLDASSGESEASPQYVQPDDNPGTKMWNICGMILKTIEGLTGTSINEFSTDGTMAGDSDDAVPTEKAVKTYADTELSGAEKFTDRGDPASYDFAVGDLTTDGTWKTAGSGLDLSGIVDAGATAVLLRVHVIDDALGSTIEFRKSGSSNAINISMVEPPVVNVSLYADLIVPLASDRIVEYKGANVTFTTINIAVKGWWK